MMKDATSRSPRLSVLIDADNANPNLIDALLKEISKYGTPQVKRIYGDWTSPQMSKWKEQLLKFSIQPIQQYGYTTGKNSTDSALIIDAMDLLYTKKFEGFCIVSSDSDFTRLASRIRESGCLVYGLGEKKTPEPFVKACDKFIYTEILGKDNTKKDEKKKPDSKSKARDISDSQLSFKKKIGLDEETLNLLNDAYESASEEDEWADLAAVGSQLSKLSPSFDSRNYGYKKLSGFFQSIDLFDVKETPHSNNPSAKVFHIRLKS
ncbi:MAG: NYN domain-containing protein [Synechococcaceae cyanobacterium SM2_3_2]|nr:NYN domain-containing protein [Synechococcaceae cyanobacterium SM2_3_2]